MPGLPPAPSADGARLEILVEGSIDVRGRMPGSTNVTLLVELRRAGERAYGVYKPRRGERPLWDFPPGLWRREIAAYQLSETLGWALVPPTVRREGPYGEGSVQLFVDADFRQHYFTLRAEPAHQSTLRRLAAFDVLANNADRKSGHCLLDRGGRIHAIDNGLAFHVEAKLRTVIWDFAGEPVPRDLLADVGRLARTGIPDGVAEWLSREERAALRARARALVAEGRFPDDRDGVRYPWPPV